MPNDTPPSIAELTNANLAEQDALLHPERYDWESLSPTSQPFRAGDMRGLRLTCRHCGGVVTHAEIPNDMLICETCGSHQFAVERLVDRKNSPTPAATLADTLSPLPWPIRFTPELEKTDNKFNTLLAQALLRHDNARAIELIRLGANVNVEVYPDDFYSTSSALTFAAAYGKSEIVRLMLEHKADIFGRAVGFVPLFEYQTPVARAAENGQWAIVDLLLANGAKLHAALEGAVRGTQATLVRSLIKRGAQAKDIDELLRTAIDSFRHFARESAANEGNTRNGLDTILALLEQGANPNAQNDKGETALHLLLNRPVPFDFFNQREYPLYCDVTRQLLEHGANATITDHEGQKPSYHTIAIHSENLLRLLLQHGADVSALLFNAVECNNKDRTHLLIQYGAQVNMTDREGRTPLFYTFVPAKIDPHNQPTDEKRLFERLNNQLNIAKLLLESGANVNFADPENRTPLICALEILSQQGIQRLLRKVNERFITPCVQLLLENGADANHRTAAGDTALKLAKGYRKLTDLLKQYGARE